LIGTLVVPNPPSDAGHAIGEGDGGDVMASGVGGTEGPSLELIGLLDAVGCEESGSSSMDEEHAGVGVSAFGDATHTTDVAGGRLARGETEVVGGTSTGAKASDIADGDQEGGGREDANAGDGEEKADGGDRLTDVLDLIFEFGGLSGQLLHLLEGLEEGAPEVGREEVVVESPMGMGKKAAGTLGDEDSELGEKASDGIDASRAGG
jgi:hypothetical protein